MFSRMNAFIKRFVKSTKPKNCDEIYFMNGIAIPKTKSDVPDFKYKIILKRNITAPVLGRWRVDKEKFEEDKIIDWANHDHCGSESCKLENTKLDEKEENEKEENEKDENKNEFTDDDYMKNYMTAFVI